MMLVKLCLCASLVLTLPQRSLQSCSKGKPRECAEAEFAPGTNLAGEGFDISKMERKGAFVLNMNHWKRKDKTCTLCRNPYLENKKQKLPLAVVDWRAQQSCSMKVDSKLHRSSESLVNSASNSVENNWKTSLEVGFPKKGASLMLAGTHSKLSEYSMGKTKNDKYSFTSHSMSCEYYSYRVSKTHRLDKEFRNAVQQLPSVYSADTKQDFYGLIDTFGTHYITKVKLGGSVTSVTSIKQCMASLEGISMEDVQMCLKAEASVSTKRVTVKAEAEHCKKEIQKTESKSAFSSLFSDRLTEIKGGHTTEPDLLFSADKDPAAYKEWLTTLPQYPDIVSYSLDSLHDLLPKNTMAQRNLRSAITHYILEKGLWRNCSDGCQAGVRSDSQDRCVCQCHNNNPAVNSDCCPTQRGMARVIITVQRAEGLWGDYFKSSDGYVKVFYGKKEEHTNIVWNNNNPHWGAVKDMGDQVLSADDKPWLEVWDRDNTWDDDLLGKCTLDLSAGTEVKVCNLHHGRLFYKWEVTCAPSLGGRTCTEYKATPMNKHLRSLYVSRHAQPVPKAFLLEMGVFVNETSSKGKQSLNAWRPYAPRPKFDEM